MAHRRNKDNRPKPPAPVTSSPVTPPPVRQVSSAAQAVVDRITRGGVDYLMDNLVSVMTGSGKLAQEPEFIDLTMDMKKTSEVTWRWLKKYDKLLTAAEKKGKSEFQQVYDEVRIKFIDELATPPFRKEVDRRLNVLIDRFIASNDVENLEMALILAPLLKLKKSPWGLCMLIIEIHRRTMNQSMQEYAEQEEIRHALEVELKSEGIDVTNVEKMLEFPGKLEQIGQKLLGANPEMRQRLEKDAENLLNAFEDELVKGKVDLNLFSEAELVLPFELIAQEIGKPIEKLQPAEVQDRLFERIRQAIIKIMTPERLQQMRDYVKSTAKTWIRERRKWMGALDLELSHLEGEQYEDNRFITSAFIGQWRRVGNEKKSGSKAKK